MQGSSVGGGVHDVIIPIKDLILSGHVFGGRDGRSICPRASGTPGSAESDGVFGDLLDDAAVLRRPQKFGLLRS